jgi:hypothetical protein
MIVARQRFMPSFDGAARFFEHVIPSGTYHIDRIGRSDAAA